MDGKLSVTKSFVPFTSIAPDHAIEHENCKVKVCGEVVGITQNKQALNRFFAAALDLNTLVDAFETELDLKLESNEQHHEFSGNAAKLLRIFKPLDLRSAPLCDGSLLLATDKSKITHMLEELDKSNSDRIEMPSNPQSLNIIEINGMTLVQSTPKTRTIQTCKDFDDAFINRLVCTVEEYDQVHLAFDKYMELSLKARMRAKRTGASSIYYHISKSTLIKNITLKDLLSSVKTKAELTEYSSEKAKESKWIKRDQLAQDLIVAKMDEGPINHILTFDTAHDMWQKLLTVYDKKSEVSVHMVQQKFFNYKYEGQGLAAHVSSLEDIRNQLKQLGEDMSDHMLIIKILMTLPNEFAHFASAWESVDENKQTLNELMSRLLIE
ncbi:hypothetical protein ILUMI_01935 [Ignelater luminosus]|uniref:Uncharacterized protein n=1 Tax=Ignelater luminosus TaxID=2038154 RepID=A0A8K0DED7_IGNLU|nr:hypothetical protein ILUMI_01935 [Ignelater luminosus]